MEFLRVDGRQPECQRSRAESRNGICEYKNISDENQRALILYDLACPWGDLDYTGIAMAFRTSGIRRGAEQKKYMKKIITIHRMVKEYYAEKG